MSNICHLLVPLGIVTAAEVAPGGLAVAAELVGHLVDIDLLAVEAGGGEEEEIGVDIVLQRLAGDVAYLAFDGVLDAVARDAVDDPVAELVSVETIHGSVTRRVISSGGRQT
jgi:hypothetical protein